MHRGESGGEGALCGHEKSRDSRSRKQARAEMETQGSRACKSQNQARQRLKALADPSSKKQQQFAPFKYQTQSPSEVVDGSCAPLLLKRGLRSFGLNQFASPLLRVQLLPLLTVLPTRNRELPLAPFAEAGVKWALKHPAPAEAGNRACHRDRFR